MEERLQKILAAAGVASRRDCEQIILAGRVAVNGQVVTQLGTKADRARDTIAVDGRVVSPAQTRIYVMLNKPVGYLSTVEDTRGRPTVLDLVPRDWPRVYPVGRLDLNTEGLLILTNDGAFANRVLHPRYVLEKEYLALVEGRPSPAALKALREGVEIDGQRTAPAQVDLLSVQTASGRLRAQVRIVIHEGRKRQVRRMLEAVGHPVLSLRRTRVGSLNLGSLAPGAYRPLTPHEVRSLIRPQPTKLTSPPASPPKRPATRERRWQKRPRSSL